MVLVGSRDARPRVRRVWRVSRLCGRLLAAQLAVAALLLCQLLLQIQDDLLHVVVLKLQVGKVGLQLSFALQK
jgi:hypothetical protein